MSDEVPLSARMNIWKEMVSVCSSKFISRFGRLLVIIILSRFLTVDEVGVYIFLYATVAFFSTIIDGIGRSVRKRVSEERGKQSEYLLAGFALAAVLYVIFGLLTALLALSLGRLSLIGILQQVTPAMLLTAFLFFISQGTGRLLINYTAGLGVPGRSEWIGKAVPGALSLVLTYAALAAGYGLPSIFLVGTLSFAVSIGLLLLATKPDLTALPERGDFVSVLSFGKWSVPGEIVNDFYNKLDIVVLGLLVTAGSVGFYEVSNNTATIVFTISYGLYSVASVNISGLHAQGMDITPVVNQFISAAAYFPLASFAICFAAGEDLLVFIFGAEYAGAYWYLVGLSLHQVIAGYRKVFEAFFQGIDRPSRLFYANGGGVVINLIVIFPLVEFYGGLGVVISTVIAGFSQVVLFAYYTRAEDIVIATPRVIPLQFGSALGTIALFYTPARSISMTALTLSLTVIGMFVVYTAVIALLSQRARQTLQTGFDGFRGWLATKL